MNPGFAMAMVGDSARGSRGGKPSGPAAGGTTMRAWSLARRAGASRDGGAALRRVWISWRLPVLCCSRAGIARPDTAAAVRLGLAHTSGAFGGSRMRPWRTFPNVCDMPGRGSRSI